ncbi:Alpha/Beta hydrolase protein [Hyaloraphidium curvatum]|nr:Alpha/Beta hydrolase protein [Hyaloraphidium curvatum]
MDRRAVALAVAAAAATSAVAYAVRATSAPSPRATERAIADAGGATLILPDDRLLEYFEHGDRSSPRVLLAIHGAQTTGNLFALLDPWARRAGIRIVAPTLPGFGHSSFPHDGYSPKSWVRDAEFLLGSLGIREFDLLGTSLGSIHAATLAATIPAPFHVRNIALYVAFAPFEPGVHDPMLGSVLKMFSEMRPYATFKRLFEGCIVLPLMRTLMPAGDVSRSIATQWEGLASIADVIYAPWDFDYGHLAEGRKLIVVSGKKDNVAPPHNQKRLVETVPGAVLVEYDGEHDTSLKEVNLFEEHMDLLMS